MQHPKPAYFAHHRPERRGHTAVRHDTEHSGQRPEAHYRAGVGPSAIAAKPTRYEVSDPNLHEPMHRAEQQLSEGTNQRQRQQRHSGQAGQRHASARPSHHRYHQVEPKRPRCNAARLHRFEEPVGMQECIPHHCTKTRLPV